ncbi:helix-turn-helix transcriptional regulator [Pseudofrankia sp. BMG5.37]|uniref:helix-turn-helix transcriptional regulator n=1 Tax=Pseudofrankia sp. BMG5.37 TaxID=3050035 RepID=UPI002895EDF8|nr:helix-turn-helix transcriptional regulator [Pseudofrankia sp. BMG5.37]MDT3444963.1 helix-turn-helix transcriptional regulator [Pseudofrankia sp. BMG5.37]MDT3445118.1 helix-turn-helix transcriptional regulator [Pseudofrankia sp. BMG5.37]MDT3446824.1 helix-turn-helix transcriptional regulator [Pseudofrankia sp. BMG5.37]MDT3446836.1 helix-turn-helix transcriptional regulator [Pseudofrankia sp. BMG5.37]
MDNRDEVKAFLSSRRARITPGQAGLPTHGRSRRVPGLRRSEVADLAGVSVEYYARLERGNLGGVSESVLVALARALQLDEAERAHLVDLARAAGPATRTRRKPTAHQIRPTVARILDGMTELPALVNNGRLDVLAANPLAEALFAPVFADPARPVNHARFTFLNPRARDFWIDWERAADDSVAMLRLEAGRDPYDKALSDLVGELCTRSDAFRVRWAAHDVRLHRTGLKHFHHPLVGDLHLSYEVLELPADPGLALIAFSAEAGSPNDDALKFLASWAATHNPADALRAPNQK